MKVILYMAITPNGLIATKDDNTDWVSETEWASFSGMIKKHGNMIIGRRTYEVMLKNDEFNQSNLNHIKTVVVSDNSLQKVHDPRFIFTAQSPQQAIDILAQKGFETIMVSGGGGINASFMREGLIDELYLDIEPTLLGDGIPLFAPDKFNVQLELLDMMKLSKDELQLHYRVKK